MAPDGAIARRWAGLLLALLLAWDGVVLAAPLRSGQKPEVRLANGPRPRRHHGPGPGGHLRHLLVRLGGR